MNQLGFHVESYLMLATALFTIGAIGFLTRRNLLIQLMSVEIMLNAVNLLLVAFNRMHVSNMNGQMFTFFVIAVAAAEVAVGLAIALGYYRIRNSVHTDDADTLRH